MRFVVDECLWRGLADILNRAGHDAVHILDLDMRSAADTDVMAAALARDAVLLTEDTDFGELHARQGGIKPSVVLFRRVLRTSEEQAAVLFANLDSIKGQLETGAIVVFGRDSTRLRLLPIEEPNIKGRPDGASQIG